MTIMNLYYSKEMEAIEKLAFVKLSFLKYISTLTIVSLGLKKFNKGTKI